MEGLAPGERAGIAPARKWKAPAPGAWSEGHQALLREVNSEDRPGNRGKTRGGHPQLQSEY